MNPPPPHPAAEPPNPARPAIELRSLSVIAGDRRLLDQANLEIAPHQVTLIVGPSGVGKSILLRIIAGLIDSQHATIHVSGESIVAGEPSGVGRTGVVFQSHALFDELPPRANIQFARDHAGRSADSLPADELLDELQIPADVRTVHLSGGQRQRLAIARALAYNPPAILLDEPTSGLDPYNAARVAELIRQTQQRHATTLVVVTHDYQSLVPIADRVVFFDARKAALVELPRNQWSKLDALIAPGAAARGDDRPVAAARPMLPAWQRAAIATGDALLAAVTGLLSLVPTWKSWKWGARYLLHYARLVAGPTAWLYLAMTGMIIGFTTTHFVFEYLPYASYTEPLLVDDLLSVVGFASYRVFVPVMATVLIAARCGAAITADIGSKQYGNQIDAMATFGASPRAYLYSPIMWAFAVGTPLLTLLAFFSARLTSLVTFAVTRPEYGPDYWHFNFHRGLHVAGQWVYFGSGWMLSKAVVCGLGIAIIAYGSGRAPKYSSNDISLAVTRTILYATLFVMLVHFGYAFFEFRDQLK